MQKNNGNNSTATLNSRFYNRMVLKLRKRAFSLDSFIY